MNDYLACPCCDQVWCTCGCEPRHGPCAACSRTICPDCYLTAQDHRWLCPDCAHPPPDDSDLTDYNESGLNIRRFIPPYERMPGE